MKEIDVVGLCQTWYNSKDRNFGGLRFTDLQLIELRPWGKPRWTYTTGSAGPQGPARQLTMHNSSNNPAAAVARETIKEKRFHKVKLLDGILKGYHGNFDLLLPEDFKSSLGDTVPVYPGEEVKERREPLTTTVSGYVFASSQESKTTMKVVNHMAEFLGSFECTVGLKGLVLFKERNNHGGPFQVKIEEIIKDLQRKPEFMRNHPELADLRVQGQFVLFDMNGTCQIEWDLNKDCLVQQTSS